MMIKEFNSLEEIQKYYDEKTSTYVFKEKNEYISLVKFNFDLNVKANIKARNITAWDITANDIEAENINAWDINADKIQANRIIAINIDAWNITTHDFFANNIYANDIIAHNIDACDINANNIIACDILYWTVCVAIENIKCKSIKGRYRNAKHFVLDGKLEVEEDEKEDLEEEIEFIHSNRTNERLLRPLKAMEKVILEATNTYTNLSLFVNDYARLYYRGEITERMFNSAMNDLYLLALYIIAVRR